MLFNCGEDHLTRLKRLEQWRRWFAWYPVRVGPTHCAWLEYVERKGVQQAESTLTGQCYIKWKHRFIGSTNEAGW